MYSPTPVISGDAQKASAAFDILTITVSATAGVSAETRSEKIKTWVRRALPRYTKGADCLAYLQAVDWAPVVLKWRKAVHAAFK